MSHIEEIKRAIESLPEREYSKLRKWLSERDWHAWDRQIEEDSKSGKLDFLIDEALEAKKKSILNEL